MNTMDEDEWMGGGKFGAALGVGEMTVIGEFET